MWSSGTLVPVHSWGMPPYNKGTCANLISWFNLPLCSPYSFSSPVWIFVLGFLKKGKCISWKLDTFRDWVQILPHITSENNCGCGPISIPVCACHKSHACFGACWVDCNSSHEHSYAGAVGCCVAGYRGKTEAVHLPLKEMGEAIPQRTKPLQASFQGWLSEHHVAIVYRWYSSLCTEPAQGISE